MNNSGSHFFLLFLLEISLVDWQSLDYVEMYVSSERGLLHGAVWQMESLKEIKQEEEETQQDTDSLPDLITMEGNTISWCSCGSFITTGSS